MPVMLTRRVPPPSVIVGAAALVATGGIHLWLYLDRGYRDIPTIRYLFILMVIAAGLLAGAVLLARNVVTTILGAGFLASVLGGYVLSATVGLFGFTESGETGAAWAAGACEVGGAAILGLGALTTMRHRQDPVTKSPSRTDSASN